MILKLKNKIEKYQSTEMIHLPVLLTDVCPKCKIKYEAHLDRTGYLDKPFINETFLYIAHCKKCNHEWTQKMKYTVTLKLVK